MNYITVKSQKELDGIPIDADYVIRIEFGTWDSPAIVHKRYKYPVEAWGYSSVVARGNASVEALEHSSVVARGNASVEALEHSSVEALEHSSVIAWENASVEALEHSSVEAWGYSSVVARGNVQVVDYLQGATIQLSENARIVYTPKNIKEFMDFYCIEHDETTAVFYKAVHKIKSSTLYPEYISNYDRSFKYEIGKKVTSNGFDNSLENPCGKGIHISYKSWALDYGRKWDDLAILEVKVDIKDILLPKCSDGKARVPEAEIIREVPLEECGLFGKILLQKRKNIQNNQK